MVRFQWAPVNYFFFMSVLFIIFLFFFQFEKNFFLFFFKKYFIKIFKDIFLIINIYTKIKKISLNIINCKKLIFFIKLSCIQYFCYIWYVFLSLSLHFIWFLCNNYYFTFNIYSNEFYYYYSIKLKFLILLNNELLFSKYSLFLPEFIFIILYK